MSFRSETPIMEIRMKVSHIRASLGHKVAIILTWVIFLSIIASLASLARVSLNSGSQEWKSEHRPLINPSDSFRVDVLNYQPEERNESTQDCQIIHLAFVCGGFNSTRNLYVLLKSILFYRTDVIHLHLFVDEVSRTILSKIFETWTVQDLMVRFYNTYDYEHEISWITSQHYSHRYGLMKLAMLPILADSNLTKVIILDTDMLVLGNINRVWHEFHYMNKTTDTLPPIFGMVENQSDWYIGNTRLSGTRSVWPAIGRGFNSGLLLVNLVELKHQNWTQIWRQETEIELTAYLSTALADQDILNAIIRSHSHMIYRLPCFFNLQLNDHIDLDEMCPGKHTFRIVHWNSPYKLSTKNSMADYYLNWYLTFRNWDGKLLEKSDCQLRTNPNERQTNTRDPSATICNDIRPNLKDRLRTYIYFFDFELDFDEWDLTLVVHLSIDRLQVLDELASHWLGPISAAIYLSELETNLLMTSVQNSNNLLQRKNIGYHLVFRDSGFNYPINRLRNIALNNTMTPYVLLSDIDFLPSFNLYNYLRQTISDMASVNSSKPLNKQALVIAAFENLQYKFEFPSSKAELLTQLNLGSVSMFRDQIWPLGHAQTNYAKWRVATKPYNIEWKPEYEPFIVTSRDVPRYDERFVGFGWNKVESIMQLAALDYEFLVLPEAFLIHKFHSASYDIMQHRGSSKYRSCIKHLKKIFFSEMRQNYPDFVAKISATNQLQPEPFKVSKIVS